eukprot:6163667-Lingulodinium_polyedra.AAC.1
MYGITRVHRHLLARDKIGEHGGAILVHHDSHHLLNMREARHDVKQSTATVNRGSRSKERGVRRPRPCRTLRTSASKD